MISQYKKAPVFLDLIQSISASPFRADGTIIENELLELFEKFLLSLPESRRKIFVMHYIEELSSREIADRLGISQKTVQNQMKTAENELRKKLSHFLTVLLTL
jgi:RNA polymerase sigma-70 factor (ECF subfamily)